MCKYNPSVFVVYIYTLCGSNKIMRQESHYNVYNSPRQFYEQESLYMQENTIEW